MKKIVHDAFILTAFTIVIGVLLGLVYEVTKAPIAKSELEAAQAAYKEVFAEADHFNELENFDKAAATEFVVSEGYTDAIDAVQVAYDSANNVLGYVITVTAKDASQSTITFSVGVANDGTCNGYSITNIAETPGLGMKADEESFYSQFKGKMVDKFVVVKQAPADDSEIESISGATITSKAMANGCNAAICYFRNKLEGGAN